MMKAVKQNRLVLEYASKELQGDDYILEEVILLHKS